MQIKHMAGQWGKWLENSLFPLRCPCCLEPVEDGSYGICSSCLSQLRPVQEPFCLRCGRHIEREDEAYCDECLLHPKSFAGGFPLLRYDGVSAPIMYDIKYQNKREYIGVFAKMIAGRWGSRIRAARIDWIIPVPLHRERLRERGYNQALLLAKDISACLDIPLREDVLCRMKNTRAQKALGPGERLANLKEAFVCRQELLHTGEFVGKNILLADDIYTTGATVEACTLALQNLGVGKVYYTSICIAEMES